MQRTVSQAAIVELEGMVRSIAAKVRTRLQLRLDSDDLVQMGMVGLLEAAERYDPESGVALSTFAYTRIQGAILDGVGQLTGIKRGQARRTRRLAAETEAIASIDHADSGQSSAAYVASMVEGVLFVGCLSELVEDRTSAEQDGDSPHRSTPERTMGRAQLRALLARVLDELPEDEGALLRDHYLRGRSLSEIGDERGVSRSWASRVHTRALARARAKLEQEHGLRLADLSEATFS